MNSVPIADSVQSRRAGCGVHGRFEIIVPIRCQNQVLRSDGIFVPSNEKRIEAIE